MEAKQWCRLIKSSYFLQRWTVRCEPFQPAAMEWTCLHLKVETTHSSYHGLAFFERLCNRHVTTANSHRGRKGAHRACPSPPPRSMPPCWTRPNGGHSPTQRSTSALHRH